MSYQALVAKAQTYFPSLTIKYKDQSTLMKILGTLMKPINPDFMTSYLSTIGDTVYLPSETYATQNPQAFTDVFIHECTHMYDEKRIGFWYTLAYIFPQILAPICLLLMFLVTWKIMLPLAILFLLPLPAPWRAYFEKRAYFVQMYAGNKLWGSDPVKDGETYAQWFRTGDYYWMWIFESNSTFDQEAANIKAGNPACASEPALLQQVNDLIAASQQ